MHPRVGDGSELLGHLVQFALKVDDWPYSVGLPIAVCLYGWRLRGGIKLEHFQVKIVDVRRPLSAAARDSMSVSQRTAINDGNPPRGRLVKNVVRPQVQEHITGLKESFLQVK